MAYPLFTPLWNQYFFNKFKMMALTEKFCFVGGQGINEVNALLLITFNQLTKLCKTA
ncbi:Uncharacterised protein [Vibrio cholerae]|nr:Uncharacterised protein [Vibrio cholerae]